LLLILRAYQNVSNCILTTYYIHKILLVKQQLANQLNSEGYSTTDDQNATGKEEKEESTLTGNESSPSSYKRKLAAGSLRLLAVAIS
jgi:hypothetical protein